MMLQVQNTIGLMVSLVLIVCLNQNDLLKSSLWYRAKEETKNGYDQLRIMCNNILVLVQFYGGPFYERKKKWG